MRIRLVVSLTVALAAVPAGAQSVRDSTGIHVVENPARGAAAIAYRLGKRTLDLGGPAANTADEFNRGLGFGGLRLSDGTVVVPDKNRIQFFDSTGRRLGILGREGSGPQEFRSVNPTETCRTRGDTVLAGDYRNGRFAVIFGRKILKTVPFGDFGGAVVGCFDDGTFLMARGEPGGAPTYVMTLTRVRLDGTLVNQFAPIEFRTPSPVSRYAGATIWVSGQHVYVGDGAQSEVRMYGADGRLARIVRSADKPAKVTDADVEKAGRAAAGHPHPDTHPAFGRFVVDPAGRLWISDFALSASPVERWTVFDAEGRLFGRLEIPQVGSGGSMVVTFGIGDVQIWRVDDDGFPHLTFYALDRVKP